MKKILISFLVLFLFTGCNNAMSMDTPTAKVEEVLNNYQKLDNSIDYDINRIIDKEEDISDENKKLYRTALERQFQNMSYKIKNEEIDGDSATVDVEVEVLDYKSSYDKSKKYYEDHPEEFRNKDTVDGKVGEVMDYVTYKINELTKVEDKTKYELTFNLTKEDDEWVIDDIDDEQLEKLLGLY